LHAAECEQLKLRVVARSAERSTAHLAARFIFRRERAQQQFRVAFDYHQQLLKSCATPSGQSADSSIFLRLPATVLRVVAARNILRNDETHAPASVLSSCATSSTLKRGHLLLAWRTVRGEKPRAKDDAKFPWSFPDHLRAANRARTSA